MPKNTNIFFALLCISALAVLCFIATGNDFTGDAGDSITHYMYARYAFHHPANFFNQWAKPLFVLLASPFAQFGFTGIKIFNCILAIAGCFITYRVAQCFNVKYAWLVLPFMFFCPLFFTLVFSGLTEYLLAFLLIASVYLVVKQRYLPALLIVSFLPFVRAEGMLVIGVFLLYLLLVKKYRLIPVLLTGNIVYGIAGFFYYHNFLWMFTTLPYAHFASQYGHGGPFDFVHILMYVIEKPMFLLLCFGFVAFLYRYVNKKDAVRGPEELVLVYGGFAVFFLAHSIFWWKGIFSSGGFLVPRVLIPVVPFIALIALRGLNFITGLIKKNIYRNIAVAAVCLLVVVFPFTNRAKGLVFDKNLFVIPENELIKNKVVPFIKANVPGYNSGKIYFAHPYIGLALGLDPFDTAKCKEMNTLFTDNVPQGALVIWDDWFSVVEQNMTKPELLRQKVFAPLATFDTVQKERTIEFIVLKKQ